MSEENPRETQRGSRKGSSNSGIAQQDQVDASAGRVATSMGRKKRPKIPSQFSLTNQSSGGSGYALPPEYRTPKRRQLPFPSVSSRRRNANGDDQSVGTLKTTYTQTSRVSNISISSREQVLDQDDPFLMDMEQKIAKSRRLEENVEVAPFDLGDLFARNQFDQQGLQQQHGEHKEKQPQEQSLWGEDLPIPLVHTGYTPGDALQPSAVYHPSFVNTTIQSDDDWIDPRAFEVDSSTVQEKELKPWSFFDSLAKRRRLVIGISLLFTLVIIIIVAVVLLVPTTGSSNSTTPPPSVTVTGDGDVPTAAPLSATPTTYNELLRNTLEEVLQTGNPISNYRPSEATLDWLVTYVQRSESVVSNVPALLETAALAAMYYGLQGTNWTFSDLWLSLDADKCGWVGVICNDVGHVVGLDLHTNQVAGSIPVEIGFLTNLVTLELYENEITGNLPTTISLLKGLEELELHDNALEGELLPLTFPTTLRVLDVGFNLLSGILPNDVFLELTSLERLVLGGNKFMGRLPPSLGRLTQLTALMLHDNALTGNLENINLQAITSLQYLWISQNQVTGTFPTFVGDLLELRWLLMEDNPLGGTLPLEYGNLERMQRFDLSGTGLSGTLPSSLLNWRSVEYLNLANNTLTGSIPPEYSNMTSLSTLDVSGNSLTGSLSTTFGAAWVALAVMDVSSNALTGAIPDEFCSRQPPPSIVADCLLEIQCNCCETCK